MHRFAIHCKISYTNGTLLRKYVSYIGSFCMKSQFVQLILGVHFVQLDERYTFYLFIYLINCKFEMGYVFSYVFFSFSKCSIIFPIQLQRSRTFINKTNRKNKIVGTLWIKYSSHTRICDIDKQFKANIKQKIVGSFICVKIPPILSI